MEKTYLITKSNYFIMNSNYDLSLEEQKIILTLASMVQPEDEEFKAYKFKIADFMKLLGVENKSKYTKIPKITKELMKKVFEIQEGNKFIQTAWLSGAVYEKGSGYVELTFSPYLKPYMLKLNTMFTQYKLANVLNMKSKYSPRIYEILKCNQFKKQGYIEVEIKELRKLLKAENIYPLYADFKRKVIKQTQKELKAVSDISFDFEEVKTGRKVTSIKFFIIPNKTNKIVEQEVSATLEESNYIQKVKDIFDEEITSLQAKQIYDAAYGNIELIKEKYKLSEKSNKPIKTFVGWMISSLIDDYKDSVEKKKKNTFNDYTQRTYDYKKLERGLLGLD